MERMCEKGNIYYYDDINRYIFNKKEEYQGLINLRELRKKRIYVCTIKQMKY